MPQPGPRRITGPLRAVLATLLDAHDQGRPIHGYAIVQATGESTATIYQQLERLRNAGWVIGEWETTNPDSNRPRRRFLRLTPSGVDQARTILSRGGPA